MRVIEEIARENGWWCGDCEDFSDERIVEEVEYVEFSYTGRLDEVDIDDIIRNGDEWSEWVCSDCGEVDPNVCTEVIAGETTVFVCGDCDAVYVDRDRAESCCTN